MADEHAIEEPGTTVPQPTEEVHLPDPSYLPVVMAASVWVFLIGVTINWIIAGFGALIFLIVLVMWVRSARRELRELPLEH
jgi:hypothetical protein